MAWCFMTFCRPMPLMVSSCSTLDGWSTETHWTDFIPFTIYIYIKMVRPQIPQHQRVDVTDFFTHFRNRVSTLVLVGFHHGFSRLLVDGVVLRQSGFTRRSRFTLGSEKSPKALGETPGEIVDSSYWEFKVGGFFTGKAVGRLAVIVSAPCPKHTLKRITGWLAQKWANVNTNLGTVTLDVQISI